MASKLEPTSHRTEGVWLMIIISALLFLGALMVFSAGASIDRQIDFSNIWKYTTIKHIVFIPAALLVMTIVSRCNYRIWLVNEKRFWLSPIVFFLIFTVILLALALTPGIGIEKGSSRRWLGYGNFQFQPSELAKWITVIFLAAWSAHQDEKMKSFSGGFVPGFTILMIIVGLIGYEDFGTAALICMVGAMVLLVGGMRWRYLPTLVPIAAIGFYYLIYKVEYRMARVRAFIGGEDSALEQVRYQGYQSLLAIGSGGLWGAGLGRGTVKQGYLPEDTTDFIFAIIAEELGFMGSALVIGLYIALMICGMTIIKRSPSKLGKLVGLAIISTIGAQALINLAMVTGMTPTKGIALPFVSVGGTGLIMTAAAAGVLINIAREPAE